MKQNKMGDEKINDENVNEIPKCNHSNKRPLLEVSC